MEELLKRVLDTLKGANLWIALFYLGAGYIGWRITGSLEGLRSSVIFRQVISAIILVLLWAGTVWVNHSFFQHKKAFLQRAAVVCGLLIFAAGAAWGYYLVFFREPVFPEDVTGILVLSVVGDDSSGSLRAALIEHLNSQLRNEPTGTPIEVHATTESVDENLGLANAHKHARIIGMHLNAQLVIWGRKIGTTQFFPRITIVAAETRWSGKRERTNAVQEIPDLRLPTEVVEEPLYLSHFIVGFSYYSRKDYRTALTHFEAALEKRGASREELADLQFFTGYCYQMAGAARKKPQDFEQAIRLYESATNVYAETDQKRWATLQNDLGVVYTWLPKGDHRENLERAIAAFQGTLRIYTETDFPTQWAMSQTNLGVAYHNLPTGDRVENARKAFAAYESALRIFTKDRFPSDWAMIQDNIGVVYTDSPTGDPGENLQKAIAAYEAALSIYTEKNYPVEWARTQSNLAVAYTVLPIGDHARNLQRALGASEAALRICTEQNYPDQWAGIQENLGTLYGWDSDPSRENLEKARFHLSSALRVWNDQDFPNDHDRVSSHLAEIEQRLLQF